MRLIDTLVIHHAYHPSNGFVIHHAYHPSNGCLWLVRTRFLWGNTASRRDDAAVGDEEASSQEPIKSITTTEQTSNIEKKKKKKKKKRTRASLDGVEEEQQVVGINGPGKEILQAVDDEKQVKAEEVKVTAASLTPVEGVADMNKANTKSRSSSSKKITWNHSDEIVILCGLISWKQ